MSSEAPTGPLLKATPKWTPGMTVVLIIPSVDSIGD